MVFCIGSMSWKWTLSHILLNSSFRLVRIKFISGGFGVGAKFSPLLRVSRQCLSSVCDDKLITFVLWNSFTLMLRVLSRNVFVIVSSLLLLFWFMFELNDAKQFVSSVS